MSNREKAYVDFQRIRQDIAIEQVLSRYGLMDRLTGSGDQLRGPCPIHGGSNKRQFTVNLKKGVWHCFADCDGGGNVLDFVMAMEDCDIRSAGLKLAEWFNIPVGSGLKEKRQRAATKTRVASAPKHDDEPQGSGEDSSTDKRPAFNEPLTFERLKNLDHDHETLVTRGLLSDTAEHFGVGYATRGIMRGCIAAPVHNLDGKLVAYAGVDPASPEAPYKWPKGFAPELELFNAHRVRKLRSLKRDGLIVVAEMFDVFALFEAGHENAVALMGTRVSQAQLDTLNTLLEGANLPKLLFLKSQRRLDDPPEDACLARLAETAWLRVRPFTSL